MLAAYKLFHGKKETSFPSKNANSNGKDRHMVKTCFFRKPEICRHQSAPVVTMTQHRAEGESELQCSCNSKLSQSPRKFWSSDVPSGLYPMGANGPGLCTPASNSYWMWDSLGEEGSSIIPHRAIHQEGHSCKLSTGNPCHSRKNKCLSPEGMSKQYTPGSLHTFMDNVHTGFPHDPKVKHSY